LQHQLLEQDSITISLLHEGVNIAVDITAGIIINRFCFVLLSGPETSTLLF